jgi:tetratricopeptide (TPR) repeat protein
MSAWLLIACLAAPAPAAQDLDAAVDLYNRGRFQAAREVLAELVRREPQDPERRVWLGKAWLKLRQWDDAVEELEKAASLRPQDGAVRLWLGRAYGMKAAHASIFSAFGLARKTRRAFENAAGLSPDNLDVRFDLLQYYLEAPGIVGGGKDKAEAQAREIARVSPRLGHTARAEVFKDAKAWEKARAELAQAVEKFPEDAGAYLDLAQYLLQRADYQGAAANAQAALARDGTNPSAQLCLAAARIKLRSGVPEALAALRTLADGPLADHDPPFEEVYFRLGEAHQVLGQAAEARRAFETALGFNPEHEASKQALKKLKALP